MSWTEIDNQLKELSIDDLIKLLKGLHDLSPQNKAWLRAKLWPVVQDTKYLEDCRAVGMRAAFSLYNRTLRHYIVPGLSFALLNFIGVWLTLSNFLSLRDLYELDPGLSFFTTSVFLVVLGAFMGEWLESRRPNGRKMTYPGSHDY